MQEEFQVRVVDNLSTGHRSNLSKFEGHYDWIEGDLANFDVCRRAIDRSVLVSEDEILGAMRMVLETEHWVIEGAAGVAVAAFLREAARWQGKNAVIVICGRNVSAEVRGKLC